LKCVESFEECRSNWQKKAKKERKNHQKQVDFPGGGLNSSDFVALEVLSWMMSILILSYLIVTI
jgi:hypothetical protein